MIGFNTLSMWKTYLRHGRKTKFMNEVERYQKYKIGDGTYGFPNIYQWTDDTGLVVGKYCSIAPEVTFVLGGEHQTDTISTYPFSGTYLKSFKSGIPPGTKGNIKVGNDVWIGMKALILSGVTIGDGAVIGAGSVVVKDVEPYAIVGGNPAKLIRYRFAKSQVQILLKTRWWDWPFETIIEAQAVLESTDFAEFQRFEKKLRKKI
ncbi:MAG TPA: CatB-related O-acetyltransferase [bacterium]|nr:CatB-related O-acetyltransferase [bacterium]